MISLARVPRSAVPLFTIATLALAGSVGAQGTPGASPPPASVVRARVDSLARAFVVEYGAPGISLQVVRGRDTIITAGYGMADLENQIPAGPATLYRIGSITKQFTAAAVMRLAEQRKLALDDSIAVHLTGLPEAWRGVTVQQLLNHTSGIPAYTNLGPRWIRRWGEDMPLDTIVALTAGEPMWFAPGTGWRYDNTGYVLLGMLIERATGKTYADHIEETLTRPLGLEHTWYCDDRRILPGRARGYEREPDGWRNAPYLSMTQPHAAGALCSTVGDVARWNALLASGRVVSADSYRAMTTPLGPAAANRYGFGLTVDTIVGRPVVRHGGGINGFNTDNAYFPADSLSVTVLTNSGAAQPGRLLANVTRAALGLPLETQPSRVALSAAERRRYAGRYEVVLPDRKLPITIRAGEAALTAEPEGQAEIELIPIGNHAFRADVDPTLRVTFQLEGDRATSFTLLQGGRTVQAPRVADAP